MVTLTITNDVTEMAKLEGFTNQIADSFDLDPALSFQLQLVLDEAISNVVNYAYGDSKDMPITIQAQVLTNDEGKALQIQIIDEGVEFSPLDNAPEVDTSSDADERPIGGLGIFLIKQMMDTLSYERTNGKNVFTMVKKL